MNADRLRRLVMLARDGNADQGDIEDLAASQMDRDLLDRLRARWPELDPADVLPHRAAPHPMPLAEPVVRQVQQVQQLALPGPQAGPLALFDVLLRYASRNSAQ